MGAGYVDIDKDKDKIKIKLIEMFELHERMPGMRSAEYQATIPLKFFIIIDNYANV